MLAVVASFTFFAFTPKADVYIVDVTKSTVSWDAKKVGGGHNGAINLTSGSLSFNGKILTDGGFIANMTTIKDADKSAGLEKHLKAPDFFGVEKFPFSKFVIKKIQDSGTILNITGDLTIKGITNSITFPANIIWNADKTVTATADKIIIDRTKFDIKYKSKSFFPELANSFIDDEFTLAIKIVAKK